MKAIFNLRSESKLLNHVLLPIWLLITTLPATATIRYVKSGGTGSGTSWANASGDLQAIINTSANGDEVWVSTGNYQPASGQSFSMKEGVKLYGGMLGTETNITQRIAGNRSNLMGNGSAVIINGGGLSGSALLDGFVISGGTSSGVQNSGASPTFTDCYFTSNSGTSGGGMYNINYASPTLNNCVFTSNSATEGGGMYNYNYASPTLLNCIFDNNTATGDGGGFVNYYYGSATVTNCTFKNNTSGNTGGGVYTRSNAAITLTGCTFNNNTAKHGGGMCTYLSASARFSNCNFTNNTATRVYGGGLYYQGGYLTMIACTFKANQSNVSSGMGGAMAIEATSGSNIINCLFSGNYAGYQGGAIYNRNNTGFHYTTNCTLAGNYARISAGAIYNYQSPNFYYQNCIIYNNSSGIVFDNSIPYTYIYSSLVQDLNSSSNNNIPGSTNPLFINAVAAALSNDGDYRLQPCSPVLNKGNNTYYAGGQTPDNSAITTDLDAKPRFYQTTVDMGAYEQQAVTTATASATGIVYVKTGANGSGQSWACASGDLQAAINAAPAGGQVWVTGGTYIPNRRADATGVITTGDRNNAFVVKKDVKIYGGFAGTETSLANRVTGANTSILSGDLNSNDNGFSNNSENAYHVVVGAGDLGSAMFDGFTVQGGNCNGGSAISVNGQSVGTNGGGGINCSSSSPTFNNLIIKGNAGRYGAGLCLSSSSAVIINSTISGNAGFYGGGVIGSNCGAAFTNVLISGNTAVEQGGGMYNEWSVAPVLTNVTITGNTANNAGGAMYNNLGPALQLRNSIVFGNNTGIYNNAGTPTIQNSLVQGETTTANGNISGNTDPGFINPQTAGLSTGGNYRLLVCSPAINAGNSTFYSNGQTPDLSAITTELNMAARLQGTRVDMGAYEFTGSNNGNPLPAELLAFNGDAATITVTGNTAVTASACHLIANLLPTGGSTALTGSVNARLWVESAQPAFFVKRHYEITPAVNTSTATARVTLYFTQAEFDDFNAVNVLKLPANAGDVTRIASLLIEKRAGVSSDGTGLPLSYQGTVETINPADADIVWNSNAGRWEVSFDVAGFSGFFVKTQASVLPLTLLDFTGSRQSGYNMLQWVTADEVNTKYFALERSTNGSSFNQVATIQANSSSGRYSYNDHIAIDGKIYYRLKMVDIDAQYTYSPVISIKNEGENTVSLYPNPVNNKLTINNGNTFRFNQAGLYDAGGRLLQVINITTNPQSISVEQLKSGLYFLKFANGVTEKFMKK